MWGGYKQTLFFWWLILSESHAHTGGLKRFMSLRLILLQFFIAYKASIWQDDLQIFTEYASLVIFNISLKGHF